MYLTQDNEGPPSCYGWMSPMSPILLLTKRHISKDYTHYADTTPSPSRWCTTRPSRWGPPCWWSSSPGSLPPASPSSPSSSDGKYIYIYLIVRRNCCSFAIRKNCNNATWYATNEGTQPLRTSGTRTTIPRSAGSSWTTPTPSCPPASPSGCPSSSWSLSTTKSTWRPGATWSTWSRGSSVSRPCASPPPSPPYVASVRQDQIFAPAGIISQEKRGMEGIEWIFQKLWEVWGKFQWVLRIRSSQQWRMERLIWILWRSREPEQLHAEGGHVQGRQPDGPLRGDQESCGGGQAAVGVCPPQLTLQGRVLIDWRVNLFPII